MLHSVCSHRRHLRLDNLRTLILADNSLLRIQLATDDDGGDVMNTEGDEPEHVSTYTNNKTGVRNLHTNFCLVLII